MFPVRHEHDLETLQWTYILFLLGAVVATSTHWGEMELKGVLDILSIFSEQSECLR